jgi:hypothetical protein
MFVKEAEDKALQEAQKRAQQGAAEKSKQDHKHKTKLRKMGTKLRRPTCQTQSQRNSGYAPEHRDVPVRDLASDLSFRRFIRRPPSHILEYGLSHDRRVVAVAHCCTPIHLFYAFLHAFRQGHLPMGRPADHDQSLVTSAVLP